MRLLSTNRIRHLRQLARRIVSLYALQVHGRVYGFVIHHEGPFFGVMVGVDNVEHRVMHVLLRAAADVLEREVDALRSGAILPVHTWTVSGIAIVN